MISQSVTSQRGWAVVRTKNKGGEKKGARGQQAFRKGKKGGGMEKVILLLSDEKGGVQRGLWQGGGVCSVSRPLIVISHKQNL